MVTRAPVRRAFCGAAPHWLSTSRLAAAGTRSPLDRARAWDVGEHERKRTRSPNRAKMLKQTLLARFVVVRGDEQGAIHSDRLRLFRVRDGVARRVRAGAGEYLATPARGPHREFDHLVSLRPAQGRRFPGRAHRNDAGDAARDLRFDQLLKRNEVNLVVSKRRDQRGEGAAEHDSLGKNWAQIRARSF